MTDSNLAIWDALGRTDPKHTKPFNRSGGFKGTALKPIWIIKMLTAQFGPAGKGWGVNKPDFQVVHAGEEALVYCTVSAWHGTPENVLWGVGGDKVMAKRSSGIFCDDEAFKKAFTDAVNNAFKSLGVGADIHMGLFEDDKYVTATKAEFAAEDAASEPPPPVISDEQWAVLVALIEAAGMAVTTVNQGYEIADLTMLPASKYAALKKRLDQVIQDNSTPQQKAA